MPRAGDAFLNGALPISHSPLDRLDYNAQSPIADLEAFLDALSEFLDVTIFPIIKNLTGIDLSSPEAFFGSLVGVVTNPVGAVLNFVQALIQPLIDLIFNGLTGGSSLGNPLELLQPLFNGLQRAIQTAIHSANQATNVARQMAQYVVQIVQSIEETPVFGDIFKMIDSFAFWVLGWFGITKQSVTPQNPAVAGVIGRISALESQGTVGLEGFSDHFDRASIGTDWTNISPYSELTLKDGTHVKGYAVNAGRYTAKTLLTDNWHVQVALRDMDYGNSLMYASCPPATTDSGFTNGMYMKTTYNYGGVYFEVGYLNSGLNGGGTPMKSNHYDLGVVKEGDVIAAEYYTADNTFYYYLNGAEMTDLRWTDTGNKVSHGSGHREVVLLNCGTNSSPQSGPGFDDLSAYDIKVS